VTRNFKQGFSGRLIFPDDNDYESARRVHNGAVERAPAVIAKCLTPGDIRLALQFGRENQLPIAVRSGGHSQAGYSVCDGGIVVDLSGLNAITVDAAGCLAHAQSGARAGDLDRASQRFGLAAVLGTCPSVGLGGLSTGGGFGWLTGKYGLTCDNIVSADLVTARGEFLTASDRQNPDLFWAIRGGGGNYGVLVRFEYRLHRVAEVFGGMLSYPLSQSRPALALMSKFLRDCPDELTVSLGIRPLNGISVFAIALCYCGDGPRAEQLLAPLRALASPLDGSIHRRSYLDMQSVTGESPRGANYYARGGFIREISGAAIDAVIARAERNGSQTKLLWFDHYHGAMCRVAQDATAFPVREPGFGFLVQAEWRDPAETVSQTAWVDETMDAIAPFFTDVAYSANLGDEGADRVRRCYGPNYARLSALKRKYDPDNVLRLNQNILPAQTPTQRHD
jgi:FAD/FMN-containing dehydrogenase